jgi:hypothetical protein
VRPVGEVAQAAARIAASAVRRRKRAMLVFLRRRKRGRMIAPRSINWP